MVDIPQDALEQIRGTINTLGPKLAQIVEDSSPTPYVTKNLEISEICLGVAIFAALIGLVGTIYGFLSYKWSKETAKNVAYLHINHLRCDGYPEKASLNQYIENNSDNLVYFSTVDSICSRFTEWSSTLMNLMKQEPHNCLNEFSQGDIQSQDIVNWFCQALLIDAAIEVKKIS